MLWKKLVSGTCSELTVKLPSTKKADKIWSQNLILGLL